MASRRAERRRMCPPWKVRFATEREAAEVVRCYHEGGRPEMNYYQCRNCGTFHVGKRTKAARQRATALARNKRLADEQFIEEEFEGAFEQ